jgi:hypothetical protein
MNNGWRTHVAIHVSNATVQVYPPDHVHCIADWEAANANPVSVATAKMNAFQNIKANLTVLFYFSM